MLNPCRIRSSVWVMVMMAFGISINRWVAPPRDARFWTGITESKIWVRGGSQQRLDVAEALLWHGEVDSAIAQFSDWQHERVQTFVAYLNKHRHRIVNYSSYQSEGISIGSGAIESTVKQIGRRVKISGAQWAKDNVPQVLKHRCAYLNGQLSN
jgi:hypothetical protein